MSKPSSRSMNLLLGGLLGCFLLALGLSLAADKKTPTPAPEGKKVEIPEFYLAEIKGDVQLVHKGKKAEAEAPKGVEKDDRILTGKDGTAYLQFKSGGTIEIGPDSDVTVQKMTADKDSLQARFKMAFGRMRTILHKLTTAKSTFEVETGGVVCGIRGTSFEVANDKGKNQVSTKTYEGSVWAKVNGKQTVVDKGFGFLVGDKGSPVLEALSSQEVQEGLKFMKNAADLDSRKEMIQKKLRQTLLGVLIGGEANDVGNAIDDAKDKLQFHF